MPKREVDAPSFWDARYEKGEDGWEMGAPAPPLVRILKEAPPRKGRVAVPGCGRGHDVALFAKHGYEAVGFDFSGRAVMEASRKGRNVLQRDVFTLADEFPRAFDAVWEYTCFCAIHPTRRREYLEVLARILKKGGELMALFFPTNEREGGPPFTVKPEEVRKLLKSRFKIESAEAPSDSVKPRAGFEWLVRARRK